jgi:CRP/FNR family transcriptional regulator, cyclic AMP receptor protein
MPTSVTITSSRPEPTFSAFTERKFSPYGLPVVDSCVNCELRNCNFSCALSQASLEAQNRIKHATAQPEGALIFVEGPIPRGVYVLCQGRAKLMATDSYGKTFILKIAQPGEILGLHPAVSGKPYEVTVETLQPSQLAFTSREGFLRSIGLSHSVSEKLARLLLQWATDGHAVDGTIRLKLALTHEEMAQLIGTSRETVTRTLGEFKKQRILELHGSTLITAIRRPWRNSWRPSRKQIRIRLPLGRLPTPLEAKRLASSQLLWATCRESAIKKLDCPAWC